MRSYDNKNSREGLILCEDLCHNCDGFVVAVKGSLHCHNKRKEFIWKYGIYGNRKILPVLRVYSTISALSGLVKIALCETVTSTGV